MAAAGTANPGSSAPGASTLWPALTSNFTTTPSPNSPTGGFVNVNTDVSQGISSDANSLLPGGFKQSDLGVGQQNTSTAGPQSYVNSAEQQLVGPQQWNVTPDQTVAGQYAKLMGEGGSPISPAIQATEQATIRSNAAHGGGNDLMTQNAATLAGSQVALQVASQDAATNAQAGQFNANAANQFRENLNQFIENAQLSSQNFNQGMAMLNAQTNQQLDMLTANVNADAATTSISLNASLAQTQAQLKATLAQMGQQYNYTTATNWQAAGIASAQSAQQYGQTVQLNYLADINSQQTALMQTIAEIRQNPNLSSAQVQGAVNDAVNQFNTFVSQIGAYSAALMPKAAQGASGTSSAVTPGGTYNSPAYNYGYINSSSWPAPSTNQGNAPAPTPVNLSGNNFGSFGGSAPAPASSGGGGGGGAGVDRATGGNTRIMNR